MVDVNKERSLTENFTKIHVQVFFCRILVRTLIYSSKKYCSEISFRNKEKNAHRLFFITDILFNACSDKSKRVENTKYRPETGINTEPLLAAYRTELYFF